MDPHHPVAAHLRSHVDRISDAWVRAIGARLPHLQRLERAALVDHLPELLFGLASWVEGDEQAGRRGFEALAQGHALQRLGHGVDLETLSTEYQILRNVILEELLDVESSPLVRIALVRLNDGIDYAVNEAVKRYTTRRDKLRERFIGILGHDLRNPLNAVALAGAQITAHPCNEPKHERMAATIQRSSDRMIRMIADVIDFAHAHLGQGIPAVPKENDLGEICEEAAQELRMSQPDRDIRVQISGDLRAHVDHDRLIQALSNLIGNALQHGKDPIIVSAEEADDRQSVTTRVTNFGKAIPVELIDLLFDPFRAGHDGADRPRTNLGLGLYIVQQISLAHGAICKVTSDEASTVFEICWPRVPIGVVPNRD
ncbi:MAG: sensor histidine kinase [Myxococcales bacterium]|nr:sensor histidine kinase [Myxococcales bacterium]